MSRIEHLSSFFIERLMCVAAEIYEAVKETVSEYQKEIERTKEENHRLRELLAEISVSVSGELREPDTDQQSSHPERSSNKQDSYQRPLDSDPTVLHHKPEFMTIKEETKSQQLMPNGVSASTSLCGKSDHDTWISHADGVIHEPQNTGQGLQDTGPSLIKVKLELASVQEDPCPQQKPESPTSSISFKYLDVNGIKGDYLFGNRVMKLKLEPCDSQKTQSSETQVQSQNNFDFVLEPELSISPSTAGTHDPVLEPITTHVDFSSEAAMTSAEKAASSCGVSDPKPLIKSALSLKTHKKRRCKEKSYCCDQCRKSYVNFHFYRMHLKTHSTERPYGCEFCGKRYMKKNHLKDHQRTHTGDRRYSCSACGMRFCWTNQVKVHIQNHHRGQVATVLKMPMMSL